MKPYWMLLLIFLSPLSFACLAKADEGLPNLYNQIMLATMDLEEEEPGGGQGTYSMTYAGVAVQKPFGSQGLQVGFETGAYVSMDNDTRLISASSGPQGGTIHVEIKNNMLLFDYFAGGFVALELARRLRWYAGAGPLLIYGRRLVEQDADDDGEKEEETEADLSAGVYGRTGLEFFLTRRLGMGAGVRAMTSGLEFKETAGKIKIEGVQYYLNLSFTF